MWEKLAIPVGEGETSTKIKGDVDLVVINKNEENEPLAVISCKTSLHGRFTETLFYAVVWKQLKPNLKVVLPLRIKADNLKRMSGSLNGGVRKNLLKIDC